MALISCPECKREISDRAQVCPNCGCPLSNDSTRVRTTEDSFLTRNRNFGDLILYGPLLVIFFVLVVALMIRACG